MRKDIFTMKTKIAVITSHYLHIPIKRALERLHLNCHFIWATYDNFTHIPKVYDRLAPRADGFLVSGAIAKSAIEIVPHMFRKPIVSFQADMSILYKAILDILIENRNQDMNRIIMDFLLPFDSKFTARDLLEDADLHQLVPRIGQWIASIKAADLEHMESEIVHEITQLYDNGQIDIVICQYTNIIPTLKAHGIPCHCSFPSDYHLESGIRELCMKIELEQIHANLPAVIYTTPCQSSNTNPANIRILRQYLEEFLKENLMDCMIQERNSSCYTFTTLQMMNIITENGTHCPISSWLNEKLPFAAAVGYGIGNTINIAQQNAWTACREATFSGHSYIKNENGDFIGPLNSEKRMVIENHSFQDVGGIARRCHLSSLTIQKLLTYMKINNTDLVTTHDLAGHFGVTVRNANRILQNLERSGCAKIAYTQTSSSKGRPVKVYELSLDS